MSLDGARDDRKRAPVLTPSHASTIMASPTWGQGRRSTAERTMKLLTRDRLDDLLRLLQDDGYQTLGPTVRDGAVVHREIADSQALPAGWSDIQEPGHYRLEPSAAPDLFGYVLAAQGWKAELFPPERTLFTATRAEGRLTFTATPPVAPVTTIGPVSGTWPLSSIRHTPIAAVKPAVPIAMASCSESPSGRGTTLHAGTRTYSA